MLTRREKLLIRPWQQRRYNHHRRKVRVQSALPAIDVGPPAQHGHVCCKLKKQQSEQERTARIERDNCRLLQRMGTIMRTNRLDNHWDSPPPSFLHRVGIYYEPPLYKSQSSEVESSESIPEQPSSRKTRCLACNPQQIKTMKSIPDERIPWIKSPSSVTSTATTRTTQTSASSSDHSSRLRRARAPRHISLAHGDLHLDVSFPADSTVELEDGLFKRVLQREFCECKALQQ
ncbi:hypothetical protein C0J52_01983 [Blattella germanica]|nr:hypothetical protein C0J52_01983 [Blattella germanica]